MYVSFEFDRSATNLIQNRNWIDIHSPRNHSLPLHFPVFMMLMVTSTSSNKKFADTVICFVIFRLQMFLFFGYFVTWSPSLPSSMFIIDSFGCLVGVTGHIVFGWRLCRTLFVLIHSLHDRQMHLCFLRGILTVRPDVAWYLVECQWVPQIPYLHH